MLTNQQKHNPFWSRQWQSERLAPLVRCPHLSQFWLSASVLSGDADKLLLRGLQPQLKRLLLHKPACTSAPDRTVAAITRNVPDVAVSWLLPLGDIQLQLQY
jgi:hypothetical protein